KLSPAPAAAGTVSKYNPANARITPMEVSRLMPRFQKTASNTGTSTTETPVRKADFEAVVYFRPAVCSSFPTNKNSPTRQPERTAGAQRRGSSRKKITANTTAARLMRTALKKSGETSARAFLMTTKFEPQISVIRTRRMWALSERDTGQE